jgi:hypothetical protein
MLQLIKKRLIIGLGLIFSILLLAVPATLAGGWAVVTLDELPPQVVADQPLTIGFIVRQHGLTPMAGLTPQIKAIHVDTKESFTVAAKPEGKTGHYVATLTFLQPGGWNWSIEAFAIDQPMPTLTVLASAPVAVEPTAQSSWWSWLLGLIGLSATSYSDKTEAEEVSSAQVEIGRDLFIAKGCIVCHHHSALSEVRRDFSDFRVGPDLPSLMTMSADPAFLYKWLKDPATVKADAKMPRLELKQTEIEALTSFLLNSESTGDPAETTSAEQF